MDKRFIESPKFPFSKISEASAVEKGPGRPPCWEMVFWWTRKPLISARAIIAGSLLPENTDPEKFLKSIGIGKAKSAHRVQPTLKFQNIKLLDPFAGFGSIPLEALRLGIDTTAVELLPTAYVFLKAVLEYPSKYGEKLVKDVEKWGKWVTEELKQDPLIKELYDEDVAVYIGSWEIKCPNCGKWTPLIGNWWLARVKDKKGYKRLAWMEPKKENDKIEIKVVDLNKLLGDASVREAKVEKLKVKIKNKEFRVPASNIETRREQAICLHCDQPIKHIDPETQKHIIDIKKLPKENKSNLIWYVKYALGKYHEGDPSIAKLRVLVKVKLQGKDLKFESCTEEAQEKIEKARQEIENLLKQGDPDMPKEPMPLYDVRSIWVVNYGFTMWYQLFNPRQLLTLIKLVKLIRETGKQVEEEKLKESWSKRDAFKYAEAVVTYLAMALAKFVYLNSMVNRWDGTWFKVGESMSERGIAMQWNWVDANPLNNLAGSWTKAYNAMMRGLRYLVSSITDSNVPSPSRNKEKYKRNIFVMLDDATILSRIIPTENFDLIVTDPPYYDDVPYSELSDFYYVWLKRALSDIEDNRLKPRFLPEAFFEKVGNSWVEISTQWEKFALSEVSLNPPRLGPSAKKEDGVKHFQNLLNASFASMASRLKDGGLLVTYYAHTDPDAWKALLEAGWEAAKLRVTNAFPIATESTQSVVKRGKLSMDTSIVVVWRKGVRGSVDASELYDEMVEEASRRARELIDLGAVGRDLIIGTLAAALAVATRYEEVRVMGRVDVRSLVDRYVYPAALLGLARALARKAELREDVRSPDAMFYLIVKFALGGAKRKILESTDARIFSIGTSLDLNAALKTWRILRAGEGEGGAKVARAKTLMLVEPVSADRSKLAELLEAKGIGIAEPKIRCSVDALHVLEYYALVYSREEFRRRLDELKAKFPAQVEEALSMVKIMARVLPDRDIEKGLCVRVVEYLEPRLGKLTSYMGGDVGGS